MSAKPKILFVSDGQTTPEQFLELLRDQFDVVEVSSSVRALSRLARETFSGVYVASEHLTDAVQIGKLLQNEQILQGMPDGIVLLDTDNTIIWGNGRLREWTGREKVVGAEFLRDPGQPGNPGPRLLPVPHGPGHRPGQQFDPALRRQPLLSGACRAGVGSGAAGRST